VNNQVTTPVTVKHPDTFYQSQWHIVCPHCGEEVGFDGVFDWGWLIEAIRNVDPKSRIMPMDFDGVVERHGHYLVLETKDTGVPIPNGQLITLAGLQSPKDFTVMKIWGKTDPETIELTTRQGKVFTGRGIKTAIKWVEKWFKWANDYKEWKE